MIDAARSLLLRLLRVPPEPAPPEGSEGSLRVFRAAPAYFKYRLVGWVLGSAWLLFGAVFALTAVARGLSDAPTLVRSVISAMEILGLIALVGSIVVSLATLRLDWEMRWYMVTDRSLRIREGIWNVHEMTMTFANIQNISISQGPLQRLFGIADLRVQSAGGGGSMQPEGKGSDGQGRDLHVGWFRGVDDPQAIRDLVLARLKALRDSGLGDHDDHAAEPAPAPAAAPSGDLLAALGDAREEAARLRAVAERIGAA